MSTQRYAHRVFGLLVLLLLVSGNAWAQSPASDAKQTVWQPTWESLRGHTPAPEWFRDAKFGIYFHWGVYSVPAYGNEWYPRHMHEKQNGGRNSFYRHHVETYGDPAEYGYDTFVDQFTAEKFDAEQWCDLFQKAGARFVGPVAEHHDGFAMWDSELTPWNAMDRGPHRDILGEIAKAARERDMKVVATFHHARNNLWQKPDGNWTGHYSFAKEFFPTLLDDKDRAMLYGYMPREQFLDLWLGKLEEVIDQYDPDLIWFDSWLDEIPDETRREFLAYYFNHAEQTGQQVLVTYKQKDMPQDVCVLDLEKGGMAGLTDFAWLTDDTISLGSWCYTDTLDVKPTKVVLHSLVDIVSKNGQLLLNISPMADGTIPENQRQVLLELGAWLDSYGEAIYNTRPFVVYGHGPTQAGKGHFGGIATDKGYSADDIRYTRRGKTVYAIQLGWPGSEQPTLLAGFAATDDGPGLQVTHVELLGSSEPIAWQQTKSGVTVTSPHDAPNEMAMVYKLSVE
ncbi:alpha-L-fucosidase [Aeoliella mucimassa]|uniref:alpha-L-fucosidase n=1 Tax=Aeoliella mucimassa TaxID=2527972 RepID=A0A518AIW9_9BACT|nr:alpha-L-fucosidase [Aeoliella mucimassa]QDU54671.1 Alpha-L-fucosidase [Aeoliella mucimassa]